MFKSEPTQRHTRPLVRPQAAAVTYPTKIDPSETLRAYASYPANFSILQAYTRCTGEGGLTQRPISKRINTLTY